MHFIFHSWKLEPFLPVHVAVRLVVEHICVSVKLIGCRLTALTRKPSAERHKGEATPAESQFFGAQTNVWHVISGSLFWYFVVSPFLLMSFCLFKLSFLFGLSGDVCWYCFWVLAIACIAACEISGGFPAVRSCCKGAWHWIWQTLCKARPTQKRNTYA